MAWLVSAGCTGFRRENGLEFLTDSIQDVRLRNGCEQIIATRRHTRVASADAIVRRSHTAASGQGLSRLYHKLDPQAPLLTALLW